MNAREARSPLDLGFDLLAEAPAPPGLDEGRLEPLARFVLAAEGAAGSWSVTLALVDDERLRTLHREFMAVDEPTDVMTFPLDAEPGMSAGDIAISVERATEQGPTFGHSAAAEIEFLLVHGLLHLCGWDDADPNDRTRMLERQTELLAAFKADGAGTGGAIRG